VKWLANREPAADKANLCRLTNTLDTITAKLFILISTIDVYPTPIDVDESYTPSPAEVAEPYGRHRLELEGFVAGRFASHHIVRLPALFGRGLKKNALYDLMHDNRLDWIPARSSFQWYPVRRLSDDLRRIEGAGIPLINIATAPVDTDEIRRRFFPDKQIGANAAHVVRYDYRSRHSALWRRSDGYCMGRDEVLAAMAGFFADEGADRWA
jgi:hypothetical protein